MVGGFDLGTIGGGVGGVAGDPMNLLSSGGEAAAGAATGNPIALIAGIAGIATSIFGTLGASHAQAQETQASMQIAADEQQIEQQRQNLSTEIYRRQGIENMRKVQQSKSLARAAAVNQGGSVMGSQAGSGVLGAESQASAEGAFNQQQLGLNYQISQNIFGITSDINQQKIRLAQLGGTVATDTGISSIGQQITGGAMGLGRLTGGFGGQY